MTAEMTGRKWNIFTRAMDLFALNGYHNVSMREIADAVKIKPASIYNHFSSKEDILQAIFDYYEKYRLNCLPDADELLTLAGTEPPLTTLFRTIVVYPEEEMERMGKALRIADLLSTVNERAARIIDEVIFSADTHTKPLLERMLELGVIDPLDIDEFCNLLNSFCHSAAVRHYSNRSFTTEEYTAGLTMLFRFITPRLAS